MLSIIICSHKITISDDLLKNIDATINFEHELIIINNSQNQYSIYEAYNLGIEKSKGVYLCFIHDDILFHTPGWGKVVNQIFENDSKIGLIGIAGAKLKTRMPSAWWDCPEDQKVINIVQHFSNQRKEKWYLGFGKETNTEVVAIDGVFMTMRKDKYIYFNTEMSGFHNYDLNISMEYKKQGYKIIVTNEIVLEHFSIGTINEEWVRSTYEIHKIYQKLLPLGEREKPLGKKLEVANAKRFIEESFKYNLNTIAISVWMQLFCINPISKYHYGFWKRIVKNKLC
jgi:glycosyltransferase involved in cell wall biosynthesis